MDEIELGKAIGRIEQKLDDALAAQDAATARHDDCARTVKVRLDALESAARPTTVRQAWAWVQYAVTLAAGTILTTLAVLKAATELTTLGR